MKNEMKNVLSIFLVIIMIGALIFTGLLRADLIHWGNVVITYPLGGEEVEVCFNFSYIGSGEILEEVGFNHLAKIDPIILGAVESVDQIEISEGGCLE
jgi:hypothetical protein